MKKAVLLGMSIFLAAAVGTASQKKTAPKAAEAAKVFAGTISDSMCGAKHMMGGTARDCTLECVKAGSKFILVNGQGKIYKLSDQKKPREFAGEKVKVTGTLKGDEIMVSSIVAGK
ncbi:MAG: DUF5818 domain-containing protein [Deltaproteobacteria bacterium]